MADQDRDINFKIKAHDETGKAFDAVDKQLSDLNKKLGKGGILGGGLSSTSELLKMEIGGKLAEGLQRASEKMLTLGNLARQGKMEMADIGDALTTGVPIVGPAWQAGRNIREALTGEKFNEDIENRINEAVQSQINLRVSMADSWRKTTRTIEVDMKRTRDAEMVSGLWKTPIEQAKASLQTGMEEGVGAVTDQFTALRDARRGEYDQQRAAMQTEQHALLEAQNADNATNYGLMGPGQGVLGERANRETRLANIKIEQAALEAKYREDMGKLDAREEEKKKSVKAKYATDAAALDFQLNVASEDSITSVTRAAEDIRFGIRKEYAVKNGTLAGVQQDQLAAASKRALENIDSNIKNNHLQPGTPEYAAQMAIKQAITDSIPGQQQGLARNQMWGGVGISQGIIGTGLGLGGALGGAAGGLDFDAQMMLKRAEIDAGRQDLMAKITEGVLQNPGSSDAQRAAGWSAITAAGRLSEIQKSTMGQGYAGPAIFGGAMGLSGSFTGRAESLRETTENQKQNTDAVKEASAATRELVKAMQDLLAGNGAALAGAMKDVMSN